MVRMKCEELMHVIEHDEAKPDDIPFLDVSCDSGSIL